MNTVSLGLVVTLCSFLVPGGGGESRKPFDAVSSAREALSEQKRLPWYDAEKDQLRRVNLAPKENVEDPSSNWGDGRRSGSGEQAGGQLFGAIMKGLAWLMLGVLAVLVIWGLLWAAVRPGEAEETSAGVENQWRDSASRIRELPLSEMPATTDLLAVARSHLAAGDLSKAIIHAFAHQLVELDKHHLIQLNKGKTNREYLKELRGHPEFVKLLRPTMNAFEDVFFGRHELSRERFQVCWHNLDRFHQRLQEAAS